MAETSGAASRSGRAAEALEALRPGEGIRDRWRRVRLTALPIVQAALAAALAWWLATSPPIDHERPFFAPIAALISVGVGLGQKLRRVIELVAGVALGVLVGDLLIAVIGTGVPQIAVVVALAMVVAVFLGGGAVIVTQAAASAVLVVTLVPPPGDETVNLDRFVDATIGGVVGLAVTALLLPVNPVAVARRQLDPLLATVAELLDDGADALVNQDRAGAALVLGRARETQSAIDELAEAMEGSSEVARIAPVRWRKRGQLVGYLDAAEPVDHVARNLRVFARHVITLLRRNEPVPDQLPDALRTLAGAVRMLRTDLEHGAEPEEARAAAIAAAELATEALDQTGGFAGQVVVAQVRLMAVDLLRATGLDRDQAAQLLPSLPPGPVSYG
ncbi:MAG TPA: FUSC family protein [Jiangellaceae bacterium]|nr:FUSC family protein [Jiangellaceae bacterium]